MTSQNPSGIHPTEYNVLVKVEEVEQVTSGGIIKADVTLDREQAFYVYAHIVAVSPLAFTYEAWPEGARIPMIGDKVIITESRLLSRSKRWRVNKIIEKAV